MHRFIPHKNNPHTLRKIFGGMFIVAASAGITYLIQLYPDADIDKSKQVVVQSAEMTNSAAEENQIQPETISEQKIVEVVLAREITIEEAKSPVPIQRNKNPKTKLDEAMRYAKPQITEGKYIDISLSHQNMVLFQDGVILDAYLISSGKASMKTPVGTYSIQNKVPRVWSKTYGLYMPYWMALVPSGAFGIHELPEWPGGYKEGANHLGVPVSHGCIRLGVGPAKRVYDWADIGTLVIIHN